MKNFTAKHVLVIIALCGVLGNFLGVLYNLAGLFYAPVADGLGVGRGNVAMAQTIANLCAAGGALLTVRFTRSEKCNYKVFVLVCGAVFTASTALLAACNSMMPMYALSVLRGLASGCAGTFFVTLVIGNWFEGTTGFLTSLVFCSSGLVGAVFSPVLSSVIENSGWRSGYLAMAAVIAGLYLPSLLLPIRYRPQDCGCLPAYIGKESASVSEQKETAASTYTAVMFGFALIYCVLSSCETQYVGHLPGIADSYGMTAAVGSAMLSIAMMTNTFGKLVFGALTDKVGVEKGIDRRHGLSDDPEKHRRHVSCGRVHRPELPAVFRGIRADLQGTV